MSHPKAFGGRVGPGRVAVGRVAVVQRRVQRALPVLPHLTRAAAVVWWARLIGRRFLSVRDCAQCFDVTEQTARNWLAGFACPTGDVVMAAQMMWPDDFALLGAQFRASLTAGRRK